MKTWSVTIEHGTLDLGLLGRSPVCWTGRVEAPDKIGAIVAGRAHCAETFSAEHASGSIRRVSELHSYAVTLRGRHDRRRRETFVVIAEDETDAIRRVHYMPAAERFAGYRIGRKTDNSIVKVARL